MAASSIWIKVNTPRLSNNMKKQEIKKCQHSYKRKKKGGGGGGGIHLELSFDQEATQQIVFFELTLQPVELHRLLHWFLLHRLLLILLDPHKKKTKTNKNRPTWVEGSTFILCFCPSTSDLRCYYMCKILEKHCSLHTSLLSSITTGETGERASVSPLGGKGEGQI